MVVVEVMEEICGGGMEGTIRGVLLASMKIIDTLIKFSKGKDPLMGNV
jgi:hypothetical protein